MRVAGFDIGTNSVRAVVGEADGTGALRTGVRIGFSTRLGEGLAHTGRVSDEALARNARVLGKSVRLARALDASGMRAGATHVLRVAANARQVVDALESAAGIPVKILSEEEEAYYAYIGAFSGSGAGGPGVGPSADGERRLLMDVGGGSVTLTQGEGFNRTGSITLPVGAVTLTEKFLRHDPPTAEEMATLTEHVEAELSFVSISAAPGDSVMAIGGAATCMAAVSLELPFFDSRRVDGHILGLEEMERTAGMLSRMTVSERERIGCLGRRRAEIAVAGAVLLALLTKHLGLRAVVVSIRGLRYGLALEAATS
jgi:exopolyphosphatase/guanosine-5'-triphosphate,3'-diphosphate pyrophosphatase